ncbi:unknown [Prevotella sp. CAG:279]|nr:unknown [Prevotella sp. CAG:279]
MPVKNRAKRITNLFIVMYLIGFCKYTKLQKYFTVID